MELQGGHRTCPITGDSSCRSRDTCESPGSPESSTVFYSGGGLVRVEGAVLTSGFQWVQSCVWHTHLGGDRSDEVGIGVHSGSVCVCVLHWALARLPAAGTSLPSANTGGSCLSSSVSCPAQHLLPLTSCPPTLSSLVTVTSPQRVQRAAYLPGSPVLLRAPLLWPGPARWLSWGLPK